MSATVQLSVAPRFHGPPQSANGGYMCGLVAAVAPGPVTVRLRRPPPLATAMDAQLQPDGRVLVTHGGQLIAEARPSAEPAIVPPRPLPGWEQAVHAALGYTGFRTHAFGTCFVCGPARARGDGLRIFAGTLATDAAVTAAATTGAMAGATTAAAGAGSARRVAAPWVPDASLDAGDGKVAPEFMWAALDCPGYFACFPAGEFALLGEMSAHLDRRVHVGEPCIVLGWPLGMEGRTHVAATVLIGRGGDVCGVARTSWVIPTARPGA
ncbi:MAG: hypothetical protein U1F11_02350 [Steroidobacteraceae bacterium]